MNYSNKMDTHNEERMSNMVTESDDSITDRKTSFLIFNKTTVYLIVNSNGKLGLPYVIVGEGGFFFNSVICYVDDNFRCNKKYYGDQEGNYAVELKKTILQKVIGLNHHNNKLVPVKLQNGNLVSIHNIDDSVISTLERIKNCQYMEIKRKLLHWNY